MKATFKEFAQCSMKEPEQEPRLHHARARAADKLEGFLMKKSTKGPIKKWQWRWFVYDPNKHRLDYYEEDLKQKKVYKGCIPLVDPDCKVFVLPNDLQDKCRQSFGISTGGKSPRIFYLMAGDRKMMTKWVGRLARECKAWQESGGKKPSKAEDAGDEDAEEGVPPEATAARVDEVVAATTKANELLAQLSEGERAPPAKLKQEAEAASDEQLASAKKAMKALDYVKATISLKLAIKLDPENMEAEKLMQQAMSKMAAMDGELREGMEQQQKRTADAQKKKAAAKPLKKISIFDEDDDDEDDDGGDPELASAASPGAEAPPSVKPAPSGFDYSFELENRIVQDIGRREEERLRLIAERHFDEGNRSLSCREYAGLFA
eukprot:COSAG02_NODE_641_length_19049_cov_119.025541_4_plen_377_part_00